MTRDVVGAAAGLLALLQVLPYLMSIVRGETKPSRSAFVIWSLTNCVMLASYVASGATSTMWLPAATTLTGLVILALSVKRGMGGTSKLDLACLAIAVGAIGLWATTGSPELAVYASVTAKVIGYAPILHKCWSHPLTENLLSWQLFVTAAVLNVAALDSWTIAIALLPICNAACAGLIVAAIRARRARMKVDIAVLDGRAAVVTPSS